MGLFKKQLEKIGIIIVTLLGVVGVGFGLLNTVGASGSSSLSLSPASSSYAIGTQFMIAVNVSSSDSINAVMANLNYDASKLQFVSVQTNTNVFNLTGSASGGGGTVSIGIASSVNLTGTQKVADVTFKTLAGSGTTQITFANSSAVVRPSDGQNVWNGSPTGATYTLTTPIVTPPPTTGGGSTTGSGSSGSTTTSSGTSGSTKTTSGSTASTSKPTATAPSAAQQVANPAQPVPVSGAAISGDAGFMVAVRVVDKNGKPVSGAEVTMASKTVKSDKTGIASFTGIPAGTHDVMIKTSGGQVKGSIDVNGNTTPTTAQAFTLQAKPQSKLISYLITGIGVALLVGIIIYIIIRFWPKKPLFATTAISAGGAGGGSGTVVSGISLAPPDSTDNDLIDSFNKIAIEHPQPESVIHPNDDADKKS